MDALKKISKEMFLFELDRETAKALQSALNACGEHPPLNIDGTVGPLTSQAWKRWKQKRFLSKLDRIGSASAERLYQEASNPISWIKLEKIPHKWAKMASPYVPMVVKAFSEQGLRSPTVLAYACATIGLESSWNPQAVNRTDAASKSGFPGAGLAQITWKSNYEAVGRATGIDFVSNPQLMFQPYSALRAKAAFYKLNNMIPLIEKGDYESAAGIYNAGKPGFRSSYTRNVARETNLWLPVFC